MSKYTAELNELLKDPGFEAELQRAMSTYPLYKPVNEQVYAYIPTREELNKKIINHYRFYEIGCETPGRFLFNLETTLNEIMPYYNQMYKSIDIMNDVEDVFGNVDIVEKYEETREDKSSGKSSGTSEVNDKSNTKSDMSDSGRNVNSKTPQSQLSVKTIDNITSASEINWNENTSNSTGESTGNSKTTAANESSGTNEGKTTHTLSRKGNQGVSTYAHDMLEFRNLIDNVEKKIINDPELAKCFMVIW